MVLVPAVGHAVPGHVHRLVGAQGAGEDADHGDPADVRVRGGLDDLRDQRLPGVAHPQLAPGALRGGDPGRRAFQGGREPACDQVQQFDRAQPLPGALGGRCGGQDGEEDPARHGPLQVLDERLDVDLLAAEIALHQGFVLALRDNPLDEQGAGLVELRQVRLARFRHHALAGRVVDELAGEQPHEPRHGRVSVGGGRTVQREVQRQYGVGVVAAEGLRADPCHLLEVGAGGLQVRDHDGARHADGGALLPDHAGRAVHAVGGRDDEEGRVRRAQTGPQLTDEVGVPGGVQQVDLDAVPFDRHQGELHGALPAVLHVVVVRDAAAVLHAARPVHRPRRQRESFHQGRLARSGVADQHHVPYGRGMVGRRCPSGGSGVAVCLVAHVLCLPCTVRSLWARTRGTACCGGSGDARGPSSFPLPSRRVHTKDPIPPPRAPGAAQGARPPPTRARDYDGPAGGQQGPRRHTDRREGHAEQVRACIFYACPHTVRRVSHPPGRQPGHGHAPRHRRCGRGRAGLLPQG